MSMFRLYVRPIVKEKGHQQQAVKKVRGNQMSFAKKHNHDNNKFTYKLESQDFKKLADLDANQVYTVRGLFISRKGKYGDHPVAVGEDFFIDLPKHATQDVKDIIADDDDVQAINNGEVGIKTRPYEKDGKTYIGFDWVDIETV